MGATPNEHINLKTWEAIVIIIVLWAEFFPQFRGGGVADDLVKTGVIKWGIKQCNCMVNLDIWRTTQLYERNVAKEIIRNHL